MKQATLIAIALIFSFSSFSAPVIKVSNSNSSWLTTLTWDLGRLPMNGDTVVIPEGKIVLIDNNVNAGSYTVHIKIFGSLKFVGSGSRLSLGAGSTVIIYSGGSIEATGSPSDVVKIG